MTTYRPAPKILDQLSIFTAEQLGLHFPQQRWRDLEKGFLAAAGELGFDDLGVLADHLLSKPVTKDLLKVLASHITIGETYFFREKGIFDVLEEKILPQLLDCRRSEGRQLRIWSAGCASGEEAYSIAMLIYKIIPDLSDWQITVLATDVSQQALQKAEQGVYSQWSFRGTPSWLVEKYFRRLKCDRWAIRPEIKEMVTFSYLNLATDFFPSMINNTMGQDIIFCRNVLMYFTPTVVNRVVENFSAALVEGGWLMVSPAECSLLQGSNLIARPHPEAIPFQKRRQMEIDPASRFQRMTSNYRQFNDQTKVGVNTYPLPSRGEEILNKGIFSQGDQLPQPVISGEKVPGRAFLQEPRFPLLTGISLEEEKAKSILEEAADLLAAGKYEEATAKAQRALSEEEGDEIAMALLARIYANQGQLEEARVWGEKAIACDRLNLKNYYLLASILQEQNQGEEAVRLLKQTLYLKDDFVLAHFSLGNLAMQRQCYGEAEKHFNNVLALLECAPDKEIIPASQGVTAGALREMVLTFRHRLAEKKPG